VTRPAASPARAEGQAHRRAGVAEKAARDRIAPQAGTIRGRLLVLLVDSGGLGLTAVEAVGAYKTAHGEERWLYSIAPRLSELVRDGYAEMSGSRRRTTAESPSREVYTATEAGARWARSHR